jgi:hypothetical protein
MRLSFALGMRVMSRSVSFKHAHIDHNSIPIPDRLDVHLTDVEERLCTLLDDCTKYLADKGTHTSCRIAGGWVRDKVCPYLGPLNDNDVDHL